MPPAERQQAVAELQALLRANGAQTASHAPMRRCLYLLPVLLPALFLLPFAFSSSSEGATQVRASHIPLGPRALDAGGCTNPYVAPTPMAPVDSMPDSEAPVKMRHRRTRSAYPAHDAFDHPRDALKSVRSGRWNTSNFPLILCIGQGKTATKSLNKAFVMLGMRTAHFYGAGVYGLLYDNAAEAKDHRFMFNVNEARHVDAVLDTPVVDFYNEILLSYPNAWVILTVRKARSWIKSQQKFYGYYSRGCRKWLTPWRRGSNLVYGTECPSKEQALKRYVQHNRNVYDSVDHSRLLVMDMLSGDGWNTLCPFLKKARRLGLSDDCPPTNLTLCRKAGVSSCAFPNRK